MSSFDEENNQQLDYWQVIRNHWVIILITLILSLLTAFLITNLMSPKFRAQAKFAIYPDYAILDQKSKGEIRDNFSRSFIPTQIEVIKSPEVMKLVDGGEVDGRPVRKYTKNYGDDYDLALERLANRINISRDFASSDVVIVSVVDTDKIEAKTLANRVSNEYLKYRIKRREGLKRDTGDKLEGDLQTATLLRDSKYKDLVASARKLNLPYTPNSMKNHTNEVKAEYDRQNSELIDKKQEISDYELEAAEVIAKPDLDLISYLSTSGAIISREGLISIVDEIKRLKEELNGLFISGLGENHPSVKQTKGLLETKEEQLKISLKDVREAVVQKLALQKKKLGALEDDIKALSEDHDDYTSNFITHERLMQEYERLERDVNNLTDDAKSTSDSRNYLNSPIEVLRPANLPSAPFSPNVPLILGIGAAAGLVSGLGIAFILELLDTSVRTMEDVERYLDLPVLAVVPQDVGLLHESKGPCPDAEAYRILRTNIEFKRKNDTENVLNVVSGGAGEGKSTTILNLAYICAQGGYTTLVVDGDLRRPRLHTYLGVKNTIGLSNYLTTDAPLESVVVKTNIDNLYFMPSGILPQDAADILNSRRMTEMIKEVKSRFDMVLVDSPPILGVSDASVISSEVDHTIMVVQHRKLPRKLLLRVKQSVENVGGNIIGVVLNNVDVRSDTEYQYYTSYYTYYSPAAMKEAAKLEKAQNPTKASKASGEDVY